MSGGAATCKLAPGHDDTVMAMPTTSSIPLPSAGMTAPSRPNGINTKETTISGITQNAAIGMAIKLATTE